MTIVFFQFKKKKYIEFKKKIFRRKSHLQNASRLRFLKNRLQVKKFINGKSLNFEKTLSLAPLPWNKTTDGVGAVVTKYNKRRLLWFIRKNTRLYADAYSYRKMFTYKFFKKQTVAFSEISNRFSNKNYNLLNWYSMLIQDRRLGFSKNNRKLLLSRLAVSSLYSSKAVAVDLKKNFVPVSPLMKKFYSKYSKSTRAGLFYRNRKKSLRDFKIKLFFRKKKFLYKVKPRLKAKRRARFRSLSKVRFFKRRKFIDWWLYAFSKRNVGTISSRAAHKKLYKIKKLKLKKYFILKNSQILLLNLMFNVKSGCFSRKLLKRKKYEYALGSICRLNELSYFSKIRFSKLKGRSYWSRRSVKRRLVNKRRLSILRRKWKKRKTRLSLFIYKTKNFYKKFRKTWSLWRYKKKSKYSYSYIWVRSGLSENFLKRKLLIKSLRSFIGRRRGNFDMPEVRNFYTNKFTNYKVNQLWNFESDSSSSYKSVYLLRQSKPSIRFINRLFNFSRLKRGFFMKAGKRILFRKRSARLKTPLAFRASGLLLKKRNLSFLSKNFKSAASSWASGLSLFSKFSKFADTKNKNLSITNFFRNMKLVSNLFYRNALNNNSGSWVSNSSKFLLLTNKTNFFNLEKLDSFIVKNLKIYDLVDYCDVFKKSNLIWKSNKVRRFEKKFSIKRKVNRKYFSLFFFNNFAETNLYRLYALNYKKSLRRIGRLSGGNKILKRKIRFGVGLWRMQYMSSNLTTRRTVDSQRVKYDFTKHIASNRKYVNHLKNNLKGLRDSLRQNVKFLIKKKVGWTRVDKKVFKRLAGWSWKKRYKMAKAPFVVMKKKVWAKVKNNYKFKTMDKYDSFVGKRLIRRLKKRLFKRKKLFWTQKRFLIDDARWGNFGYFWSTISDDYNKFNTEFRKKTFKFPWLKIKPKTYFKKMRAFAWRVKNPLYWRKHGQFAKRFYPRFWYKVFRRKFPLKRHRKDWALKLGKMFAMWQCKKKKYTFYDSSAVYFKNLSINVRPKRHKNPFHFIRKFKMQYVDRDLEIFDFEMDPQFSRKLSAKPKGSSCFSWKAKVMYRKFTKNTPLSVALIFNPTYSSRKLANIQKKNIDFSDRKIFNIFTKRRSRLLAERFSAYTLYLNIIKKKILPHFLIRKLTTISGGLLETKALTDTLNDANVTYFTNSSAKYSILKKNYVQTKTISRDSLLSSFGDEASSDFQNLNYKYNFITPKNAIVRNFTHLGSFNYWDSILYAYTSKYRHPDYETGHSVNKLAHKNDLTSLVSMNSKLLNKNFSKLKNLSRIDFKKLDFLKKNFSGQYQFTSKVSKFYKKNMWIFSSFEFSSSNYSSITCV